MLADMTDLAATEVNELKDIHLEAQMNSDDMISLEKARYLPSRKSYQIKTASAIPLNKLLRTTLAYGALLSPRPLTNAL